jgi:hypothetical protein
MTLFTRVRGRSIPHFIILTEALPFLYLYRSGEAVGWKMPWQRPTGGGPSMNDGWIHKAILAVTVGVLAFITAAYAAPVLAQSEADRGGGPPGPPPGEEFATLSFELSVECESPASATFLGLTGGEGLSTTPLADPDGDGLYTGSMTVPKFPPGPRPVPPGIEAISLSPVRIVQGPPTGASALGPEYRVIKDFGAVKLDEDRTLDASVSFCEDGDGGTVGLGERIVGTDGPDGLAGAGGNDAVMGGYGDDLLQGFDGADLLVGEAGADEVYGGVGDDALYAAYDLPTELASNAPASHDLLYGGEGDDFIDTADAPGAFDAVYCGPGADLVVADAEDFAAGDCEEVVRF